MLNMNSVRQVGDTDQTVQKQVKYLNRLHPVRRGTEPLR